MQHYLLTHCKNAPSNIGAEGPLSLYALQWTVSGGIGVIGSLAVQHVGLVLAKGQGRKHRQQAMEEVHAKAQQLKWKTAVKVHAQVKGSLSRSLMTAFIAMGK